MKKTDTAVPHHWHKVVDCTYACPTHTPVPEYIRLIAQRRYTDAYMLNWESNVFPGVLGRVCDRPCEPACRRTRVEDTPVAICRLKRVAADLKEDIKGRLPKIPEHHNGKRVALVGAGPASLTVARDLLPLGYQIVMYDRDHKAGGMMRSQIPAFRLPVGVLDEEVDRILDFGVTERFGQEITSLRALLAENYDAVFIGTGAPQGKSMILPGHEAAIGQIHTGINWLANVSFGHVKHIEKRVVVLGGGNTAMDCCRTAKRLGGVEVTVVVRSTFDAMKASDWEKEDARAEGVEIICDHTPIEYVVDDGTLKGVLFAELESSYDPQGRRKLHETGKTRLIPCDEVLVAIGQDTALPWVERDLGIEFNEWDQPRLNKETLESTLDGVFFGGDAAFGAENIITAVAHGHQAAIGIDAYCRELDLNELPAVDFSLNTQKMGIHEWSYHSAVNHDHRYQVPHLDWQQAIRDINAEVELGFDEQLAFKEAGRCLNCDVQTVFSAKLCIECNACVDICPMDCINFLPNATESTLRGQLLVDATDSQCDLYVSDKLKSTRVMVKDEDVCLHCGLCAERCPTSAWDMQKFVMDQQQVGLINAPADDAVAETNNNL